MRFISELVSAGRAEAGSGIVHHSALLTADAGHLSGNSVLRRRLTVVRRLSHRLTVLIRLIRIRRLHRLTVWICVRVAVRIDIYPCVESRENGNGHYNSRREKASAQKSDVIPEYLQDSLQIGYSSLKENKTCRKYCTTGFFSIELQTV